MVRRAPSKSLLLVALTTAALGLAGCGSTTSAASSPGASVRSGIYVTHPAGAPGYFVVLTTSVHGVVAGSVQFHYEDGQTVVIVAFSGTAQAGVATLVPTAVLAVSVVGAHHVPSAFSATYGGGRLNLGECDAYLPISQITSLAGCTFDYSASGLA